MSEIIRNLDHFILVVGYGRCVRDFPKSYSDDGYLDLCYDSL